MLIFFGPVAVGGTYYLNTLTFSWSVAILGLAPGLLSTALLIINNIRDSKEDRQTNKKTLAVRFGDQFAKIEYILCIIGVGIISFLVPVYVPAYQYVWPSIIIIIPGLYLGYLLSIKPKEEYNNLLAKTSLLLIGYTLLWAIGYYII